MRKVKSQLLMLAMILCAQCTWAQDMTSTPEEAKEFMQLMKGRWTGDVTLAYDWPGQKKKRGDKIANYSQFQATAGGKALIGTTVGGTSTSTQLVTYNPSTKQIQILATSSAGAQWSVVVSKESANKWVGKAKGAFADGTPVMGTLTRTFSKDRRKYVFSGILTVGNKKTDPVDDTYTKLGDE